LDGGSAVRSLINGAAEGIRNAELSTKNKKEMENRNPTPCSWNMI
tara:strand:- start:454 stop:588 length:135 start_codon:yes stop_codon:yes gene_type:complete